MRTTKKRKSEKHWFYSNASIAVMLIIAVLLGYQLIELTQKRNFSEARRAETEAEYRRYLEQEESLRLRTEALSTPEGREEAIRERFNVVKEGEGVIYVIGESEASLPTETLPQEAESKGFFQRIKDFFTIGN